jgi:hypothetical protein
MQTAGTMPWATNKVAMTGRALFARDEVVEEAAGTMQRVFRGNRVRKQLLAELDAQLLELEQQETAGKTPNATYNEPARQRPSSSKALASHLSQGSRATETSRVTEAGREVRAAVRIQAWLRGANSRRRFLLELEMEQKQLELEEAEATTPGTVIARLNNENLELQRQLAVAQGQVKQLQEELALHQQPTQQYKKLSPRRLDSTETEGKAARAQELRQRRLLLQQEQTAAGLSSAVSSPERHDSHASHVAAIRIQRALRSRRPCARSRAHHVDLQVILRNHVAKLAAKER